MILSQSLHLMELQVESLAYTCVTLHEKKVLSCLTVSGSSSLAGKHVGGA